MIIASTIEKTRKSLVRLMKDYQEQEGEKDHVEFRNLIYGFNTLLAYWKTIKEEELEERLTALEERFNNDK
jgi:maltose-binding protein MalE